MSTTILTCPNCKSENITDLNPELRETSTSPSVIIDARCNDCKHEFTYPTPTSAGRRQGILY